MSRTTSSKRAAALVASLCAVVALSACGGRSPAVETSVINSDDTATSQVAATEASDGASDGAADPVSQGACEGLPDKAAIEAIVGVALNDAAEKPVGCEFRGTENSSDVVNFTRQTVAAKNATLEMAKQMGSDGPTPLNDPALPGAMVGMSYSVLFDKGDVSYQVQAVVGDGPAGSGVPLGAKIMKLWVGA